MALWACRGCTTLYSVGAPACPQCGSQDFEEEGVSKSNAVTGSTHYLAEGAPVPDDLPDGVRLVGPGAPQDEPEPDAAAAPPPVSASKADWVDHAEAAGVLPRDEAEALTKADLVETVRDAPQEPPSPPAPGLATTPGPDSTPPGNSGESSAPADPPPPPDVVAQMTVTAEATVKKAVVKDG